MPVKIEFSESIRRSSDMETICHDILQKMFPDYQRVLVEKEFEGGFSGSWVFLVHLSQDERPELPVVVKIASVALINQEWEGYDQYIRRKWAAAAPIRDKPVDDSTHTYSGLCYSFVGDGVFPALSLHRYCLSETTTVEDIQAVFSRLAAVLERGLRFSDRLSKSHLWATYDPLLPFNLLIKPIPDAKKELAIETPILIAPDALPKEPLKANRYVCLENFVVVKVNLKNYNITLNLPRPAGANRLPKNSYYVCLQFESAEEMPAYEVGYTIPLIKGIVVQTRDEKWQEEMQKIWPGFDLVAKTVSLPDGKALPNPLAALKRIRNTYYDVQVNYIHGDLNLENVLVDPPARDVRLIDFGLVRWDHVLHDFLRLETEMVTKILPPALLEAGLSAQHIYEFYRQLHCATFHSEPITSARLSSPPLILGGETGGGTLEKPFVILKAIRRMARDHGLFNPKKYKEYYDCLTLYLLGTLKFGNLNRMPDDAKPWPKEVAFWGAATVQELLTTPPSDADCLSYQVESLDEDKMKEKMKDKLFATLLNDYLSELERPPSWLARRLRISLSTVEAWCAGLKRPTNQKTVQRIADMLGVYEPAERQALLEAANDAKPTPATQKPASTATNINTGGGPYSGRDTNITHINTGGGPYSGRDTNINTGGDFYSAGDTHITGEMITGGQKNVFSSRFNAPIYTGRGDIYFERQPKNADPSLQEQIEALRREVKRHAPAKRQTAALKRTKTLDEALTAHEFDLDSVESVLEWFRKRLPSFVSRVVIIISHTEVQEMVKDADKATRSEWKALLEEWEQ